ncbi:pilus assembly PilX family protein [Variovorax boronicumulans]|uniref:pilus assembly PilX family protein n=1 Tax=Variovorax boronicumulans TaxID=436515 RepID=UPI0033979CF9
MITSLHRQRRGRRERGVVLLICLIVLVILLAGGVAVMRSMNTSLSSAGNLAFKRDLVNQGEQAAVKALALFESGVLSAAGADAADVKASNYSASTLASNDSGIPLALLKDELYNAKASDTIEQTADFVKIRYLIDRLCFEPGAATKAKCVYAPATTDVRGGSVQESGRPPPPKALVYRLSVRVDGPRDTQVFLQSSFTKPE